LRGRPSHSDLWGKITKQRPESWHPLIDHSIDAAISLQTLLHTPRLRERLARAGKVDVISDLQISRLCFLMFLHDAGKCSWQFRAKAFDAEDRKGISQVAGHLQAMKPLLHPDSLLFDKASHILRRHQWQKWADDQVMLCIFRALLAHHGTMPDLSYDRTTDRFLLNGWTVDDGEPLKRLDELVSVGAKLFSSAFSFGSDPLPRAPAFGHLLAGLAMIADWVASDFSHATLRDDVQRKNFARFEAIRRFKAMGLSHPKFLRLPSFIDQFRFEPRPAQRALDEAPLPGRQGSITLLEAAVGSGKTEAAFRYASRLKQSGLVDGCWYLLPPRSAASQLQRRMQAWLDHTYGEADYEAVLAEPGYLQGGQPQSEWLPDGDVPWNDPEDEKPTDWQHRHWAAEYLKRLAPARFVVATIDQALLGILTTKHAHLRLACLVRNLLVIDGIHASDDFMMALVERLVTFFRAAGGHVLLLSATVGAGARERLVDHRARSTFQQAMQAHYPLVTRNVGPSIAITDNAAQKRLRVDPLPIIDSPIEIARRAISVVNHGGRVLVLRNTVSAAIEVQSAIEAGLGADHGALFRVHSVATLHHGRFAATDRKLLDEAVEERFRRNASADAAVIVATQTLERAIDGDVDFLITDLCPIDVLLQRIGWLHRHPRKGRPARFKEPQALVLHPSNRDLTRFLKWPSHAIGNDRAYTNILAIEATLRLIEQHPTWSIPRDNRRLIEMGTHREQLLAIAKGLAEGGNQHAQSLLCIGRTELSLVKQQTVDISKPFDDIRWHDDAWTVAARLAARDWLLPLSRSIRSPFGTELSMLNIPHWMSPADIDHDKLEIKVDVAGRLDWQGHHFCYDRFGLRLAS